MRILLDCHPWQRDGVMDPARRISFCVGRGGAKTTTKRARALIKLIWLKNQRLGYAATTAEHARELNWDKLKDACEAYDISFSGPNPDVSFLDTKMLMTCHRTGSVYRLRGVEDKRDAERFRGFPQAEFQVDEAGSFPPALLEYLLTQCVSPRLGEAMTLPIGLLEYLWELAQDYNGGEIVLPPELRKETRGGCIVIGSTPPASWRGEFYEVTRMGSPRHRPYAQREKPEYANWLGYSSHAWTLKDVVDLPESGDLYPALVALWKEALREKLEKEWDDDHPVWRREYLGEWASDNTTTVFRYRAHLDGQPWNQWDPFNGRSLEGIESLKTALAALPKDVGTWHYILTMDSGGTRDPFACNVFAFAPTDKQRRIFHVFCFQQLRMYAKAEAELLIGPDPGSHPGKPIGGVLSIIGWPDAMEMDAEQTHIDELSNAYGIRVKKAEKKADYKFGAIELVNGDLVAGLIKIIKGSPLERQMESLQWKPDEYGMLREDKAQPNDSADCLVYARRGMAILFETGVVTQESKSNAASNWPWLRDGAQPQTADQEPDLDSLLAEPEFDMMSEDL